MLARYAHTKIGDSFYRDRDTLVTQRRTLQHSLHVSDWKLHAASSLCVKDAAQNMHMKTVDSDRCSHQSDMRPSFIFIHYTN